jgi:ATP/maltotriose-dependent transcriptional regulator MalT
MQAIHQLSRGHTAQAIGALRRELASLGGASPLERSKAALALGFAFARTGETEEALLAALDALARARQAKDTRGERACILLIARLVDASGGDSAPLQKAADARA